MGLHPQHRVTRCHHRHQLGRRGHVADQPQHPSGSIVQPAQPISAGCKWHAHTAGRVAPQPGSGVRRSGSCGAESEHGVRRPQPRRDCGSRHEGYQEMPTELNSVPVKVFLPDPLPRTSFAGSVAPGLGSGCAATGPDSTSAHIHLGRDLVGLPVAATSRRRGIPSCSRPMEWSCRRTIPSLHRSTRCGLARFSAKHGSVVSGLRQTQSARRSRGPGHSTRRARTTMCRATRRPRRRQDDQRCCSPPVCIRGNVRSRLWRSRRNCSTRR